MYTREFRRKTCWCSGPYVGGARDYFAVNKVCVVMEEDRICDVKKDVEVRGGSEVSPSCNHK
jgi:hypothetical protein